MQKQAPSVFQLATIAGFALSCFGILLFLWVSFGGPTPLKAKGYTLKVPFTEAGLLAVQSDVRISGISVGKVSKIDLGSGKDAGKAVATVELNDTYAPIPSNTRALLRQKTLLGETYVELTPGNRDAPPLPDGGQLPALQVSQAVQLDEIFQTFNEKTRVAFQNWMLDAAAAFRGRSLGLNQTFGLLEPTFTDANKVLRILDTQKVAVRQFVRNTGRRLQRAQRPPRPARLADPELEHRLPDDRRAQPPAAAVLRRTADLRAGVDADPAAA